MWLVQTKSYADNTGLRIGLVTRPWGFTDSPDCEAISCGESTKSPDAVAIGRHGNYLFWGFAASPEMMTEEAKTVFANAIVYAASKRGERIIARKYEDRTATKAFIKDMTHSLTREAYEDRIAFDKKFNDEQLKKYNDAKAKKDRGEKLTASEERSVSMKPRASKPTTWKEYIDSNARMKELQQFGTDNEKMIKFLNDNADYLYGGKKFYEFEIDEDAKSLKTSIVDKELLNKAIELWESGKDVAKAKRILDRYSLCTFETAEEWRNWYNTNKDKLFFTQSGGWIYMVDTDDEFEPGNNYRAKAAYVATRDMVFPKLSARFPVYFDSKLVRFDGGQQGIVTRVKILEGHHIYSIVADGDAYTETQFEYILPEGVTLAEKYLPADEPYTGNGTTRYTGDVIFIQMLDGVAPEGTVTVKYTYQSCDAHG